MLPAEFPAWDPVLFDLPGFLDIRYYGLMYVLGFVVGQMILTRLAKARFLPIDPEKVGDFIFYLVLGVILGGRLGYWVFYDSGIPIYAVWKGGLSFHGGLIGVIVASILFARKNSIPFLRLADATCLAGTPGVFLVRMANFINGELYGRITSAGTWGAMQFPDDPVARTHLHFDQLGGDKRLQELAVQTAYGDMTPAEFEALLPQDIAAKKLPWAEWLDWEKAREGVPFRHPSQLYEGFGEGLLVGILLFVIYWVTRGRPQKRGLIFGTFLCSYSIVRFCIEFVRNPDSQFFENGGNGTVLFGMTMGQTLCAVMLVVGVFILLRKAPADVVDSNPDSTPPASTPPDSTPPVSGAADGAEVST